MHLREPDDHGLEGEHMNWTMDQAPYLLGMLAIAGGLHAITFFFARAGYCAWCDRMSFKKGR